MRVSLSTPRGDAPSIASNLETIASDAPSHILTHDVNRLLQYLNDVNDARGAENKEMADNIQDIKGTLEELEALLRERTFAERPPPVPHKDISVGASSVISVARSVARSARATPVPVRPRSIVAEQEQPTPTVHRDIPRIVRAISLSPPPIRAKSPPSPASLSETMSFLSSHHSDDLSLMESESYPMELPASPSWPSSSPVSSPESSTSSSPTSAPPSSLTPSEQLSDIGHSLPVPVPLPRMRSPLGRSPTATPPPLSSSPSPSAFSSDTVRPVPTVTLSTLREGLDAIRQQVAAMLDQQNAANRQLDELRNQPREPAPPPPVDHWDEFGRRLVVIEASILRLLEREEAPRPRAPESIREREPDAESSVQPDWQDVFGDILRDRAAEPRIGEPPVIVAPVPSRPGGPSFDEQLMEILMAPPPSTQQQVHPPPPLIPLIYRPGPRARPRSTSPRFEADIRPRPSSFPLSQPTAPHVRPRAAQPRAPPIRVQRPPASEVPPSEVETQADMPVPTPAPTGPPVRRQDDGPDIDFLREVQQRRGGRDGFYVVCLWLLCTFSVLFLSPTAPNACIFCTATGRGCHTTRRQRMVSAGDH